MGGDAMKANLIPELSEAQANRFWSRVTSDGDCWVWIGGTQSMGYGTITFGANGSKSAYLAHRVSYTLMVAPIPEDLVLDHLCRNTRCVNPNHLDPVPNGVNVSRGKAATRPTCKHGHARTEENTYRTKLGHQKCRECARASDAARRPRR